MKMKISQSLCLFSHLSVERAVIPYELWVTAGDVRMSSYQELNMPHLDLDISVLSFFFAKSFETRLAYFTFYHLELM